MRRGFDATFFKHAVRPVSDTDLYGWAMWLPRYLMPKLGQF